MGIGLGRRAGLTYQATSLELLLEGAIIVAVLAATIMGTQPSSHVCFGRLEPAGVIITLVWLVGLWLVRRVDRGLPWLEAGQLGANG